MTSKHKRLVIRIVSQALAAPICFVFRLLPWTVSYWVSDRLANAAFHLFKGTRVRVLSRLRWVYGEGLSPSEREVICRGWFRHFFSTVIECLKLSRASLRRLADRVVLEGEGNLQEALAQGRGVILVTAHFGQFEYVGARLCQNGYPLNDVVAPDDTGLLTKLHATYGLKEIEMGVRVPRAALQVLKRGEILVLLIDWNLTPGPVSVSFLGKPTPIPRGAAVFALRTGAPVLFACIVRHADRTHRLIISPPFSLITTADKERDIAENMQQFIQPLESYVKRFPEQWYTWQFGSPEHWHLWVSANASEAFSATPEEPIGESPAGTA